MYTAGFLAVSICFTGLLDSSFRFRLTYISLFAFSVRVKEALSWV